MKRRSRAGSCGQERQTSGAKVAVSGIAEAGDDVAFVVQTGIDGGDETWIEETRRGSIQQQRLHDHCEQLCDLCVSLYDYCEHCGDYTNTGDDRCHECGHTMRCEHTADLLSEVATPCVANDSAF